MNRTELIEKLECHKSYASRALLAWFLLLAGVAMFVWWVNLRAGFLSEGIRPLFGFLLFLGGVYGAAGVAGFFIGRHNRRLGLFCPQCRGRLLGTSAQIVVASGRCGRCGAKMLDNET